MKKTKEEEKVTITIEFDEVDVKFSAKYGPTGDEGRGRTIRDALVNLLDAIDPEPE